MCEGDYTLKSEFEEVKKKGVGFGVGKKFMDVEHKRKTFLDFQTQCNHSFSAFGPEPGRYNLKSDFNAITKSTKKIVEYSKDQGTHINVPGPGTYQHEDTLGKTGN